MTGTHGCFYCFYHVYERRIDKIHRSHIVFDIQAVKNEVKGEIAILICKLK